MCDTLSVICHCFSGCPIRGSKKTLLVWVQETRAEKGFPCHHLKYLHCLHRSVFLFVHFYELLMRHVLSSLYFSQNRESLAYCEVVKLKLIQLCPTLCDPMGYPVHGILQARILEWVAFLFSRVLPNPGIKPRSSALQADSQPAESQVKGLVVYSCI